MDICAYCGKRRRLTREHLIPKSKGGKLCIGVCGPCNNARGNSMTHAPFLRYIKEHPDVWEEALSILDPLEDAMVQMWRDEGIRARWSLEDMIPYVHTDESVLHADERFRKYGHAWGLRHALPKSITVRFATCTIRI